MATKLYKKDKLKYKNGFIVDKKGKVIGVNNSIVAALNRLERKYQEYLWKEEHPDVKPVEAEPFRFETERGKVIASVEANTPLLDREVKKAMCLMDELDDIGKAKKMNEELDALHDVFVWLNDDELVGCKQQGQLRFDLKYIGNPLLLTKDKLASIVIEMNS